MLNVVPTRLGRVVLCLVSLSAVGVTHAAVPGNLPAGSNLTTAAVSIPNMAPAGNGNPALLARSLGDRRWALHGFKLPAIALELGPVDDFVDKLDALEARVDDAEADGQITAAEFQAIEAEFQPLLAEIGAKAEVGIDVSMPLPTLPVIFKAFDGVMAVHVDLAVSALANVIDGDLELDVADEEILTNSAVYVRSGQFVQVAVDYARDLMPFALGQFDGAVSAGARLKLIQGELSRQIAALDSDDDEDTAFDRAGDNYDLNKDSAFAVGLDVGAGFVAENLALGATLRNLIPAKFDFANIGSNCANRAHETERQDCFAAAEFIARGDAPARDDFTLDPQLFVEASYALADSGVTVFGGLELNKVENIAGNDYQWLSIGVSYVGPWWLPAARAGWRSNLAGSKLDVISVGFNLFNVLSIEAFQSLDSARYDGDKYPRSAGVTIGFGGRF